MLKIVNTIKQLTLFNKTHRSSELLKFVGHVWNNECKKIIEKKFKPYRVYCCDIDYFYFEHYMLNIIRCVIKDDKIYKIQFG
jgi:hypothetical protein